MSKSNTKQKRCRFSSRAALAAIGVKLRQMKLFAPISERVKIGQKVVKHTPTQKLYDAFITMLAGAKGLVELNKRLRADKALQTAFGRDGCAEQSVVQQTLDACTKDNVKQMKEAMVQIYRQQSLGYRHDHKKGFQLLDLDITGMPCGKKAEFATKGYFAGERNRRGRQLGRVLASWYEEVVCDQLFDGKTQLTKALKPLVLAAEEVLGLNEERRKRTVLRVDAGGGSVDDVNWALERGYQVHCKDYSGKKASVLAKSVKQWVDDPKVAGRQVGWVMEEASCYVRPVVRVAVRCRKNNGQWGVGVLISTLSASDIISLTGQPCHLVKDETAVLLSYVYFYDRRSGGVETQIKADKQGLGMTKRNKKRFLAQQMVVQLGALAHNVVVWAKGWLAAKVPLLERFGILRIVRDVFSVSGSVVIGHGTQILKIILNEADPLARGLANGLQALLAPEHVTVILGET